MFPSLGLPCAEALRGAGMLQDGGRSWPRCRGRGEALCEGSEDGGFAAEPGAQRPRCSATGGCCRTLSCCAAARPAPRRAGAGGRGSGLGVSEAPLPPAETMAGPPLSGAWVRPQGLRGFRAPLVLLGPGLLAERVTEHGL